MAAAYDCIVIGGGHNGLVSAALLGRQGHRVLVLERRAEAGGRLSDCSPFPGYRASSCFDDPGRLRAAVEKDLALARRGLRWRAADPLVLAPLPDGGKGALALWRNEAATAAEIAKYSRRDAERWPEYVKTMRKAARFGEQLYDLAPPELDTTDPSQLLELGRLGLSFRMLGRDDMVTLMRLGTMTMADWLDEWFETPLLKAALAAPALLGGFVGPYAPATAGLLAWRQAAGEGDVPVGGTGSLVKALLEACATAGVEIRTSATVHAVEVSEGGVSGVRLADGTVIEAPVVVADIDPKHALLDLLPAGAVAADTLHAFRSVKSRGICARMFVSLGEMPRFAGLADGESGRLNGRIHFGPSLRAVEEAFDDAKYRRWSKAPIIEMSIPTLHDRSAAPEGRHLLSMTVACAPHTLDNTTWDRERNAFMDNVIEVLTPYIPNLKTALVDRALYAPTDLEAEYGLVGGHLYHGEIALDQLFLSRPTGKSARYQTSLEGYYLTGAGTHPAGAATGASGMLCAREVDMSGDGAGNSRARNRRIVTTAVGVGLALVGAGLATRGALQKLQKNESAADAASEGGQS